MKINRILVPLAIAFIFSLIFIFLPDKEQVWIIEDIKNDNNKEFRDHFHSLLNGSLAIKIQGKIDGSAKISTEIGSTLISKENTNIVLFAHEYWGSNCYISYKPENVKNGNIKVTVSIGSMPIWVKKPIKDTVPAAYTGGWTTYYEDRRSKYSDGFYRHGKKDGEFKYWDKKGNIERVEKWNNGERIS